MNISARLLHKASYKARHLFHRATLTLYLPLFLFLFAIYLLTYTPQINSSDGQAMFATAESLVRRGALDIEQIRWMGLQQGTYGLDGLLYSRKGIGVPIGLLPLAWLGLTGPGLGPVSVSLLFNPLITALTAVLLLAYLRALGFSRRIGLIVALTFGLTTLAWPYAKSLFSDPLAGLLLLGAAYALLQMSKEVREPDNRKKTTHSPTPLLPRSLAPRPPHPLAGWPGDGSLIKLAGFPCLAGLLLGWNVATRYAEAVFLPIYGLLLIDYLWTTIPPQVSLLSRRGLQALARRAWLPMLAFSLPLLLIGAGLVAFNLSRYGDPLNTGYLPNETFSGILWQGIVGQLVSPGRGLLLFCPILILSFWGMPAFYRRHRPEALLAISIIVIHLLLYGKWFMWHGGFAWGPRFMIPTLPFWAIFLAPVAARAFDRSGPESGSGPRPARLLSVAYVGLASLGVIPQFLSVTLDFGAFQGWLLDTGLPLFAPQTFFDPQYSPFLRAWSFIAMDAIDMAWAWQGRLNGWLLGALLINITITGYYLKMRAGQGRAPSPNVSSRSGWAGWGLPAVALLSTGVVLTFLVAHTHNLPDPSLQEVVAGLNRNVRPNDSVITNDPESAMPFAERYKGRAPVLGLNTGGFPLPDDTRRRLTEITSRHEQVWWLPNGLPSAESAVEQILLSTGLRARQDTFDRQRLVLFAFPPDLSSRAAPADLIFANLITLAHVAHPPATVSGRAFPVELQWQGTGPIQEDYRVFIHLVGNDGELVAQADGEPVQWQRPTSTWSEGEIVIDRHGLWIPPEAGPGDYQLRVGLYRPEDNQRLPLRDGTDAASFKVTITDGN